MFTTCRWPTLTTFSLLTCRKRGVAGQQHVRGGRGGERRAASTLQETWEGVSLVFMDKNLLWGGQHVCCCGCRGHHIVRGGMPHPAPSTRPGGSYLAEFSGAVQISRAGCSSGSTLLQRSRNLVPNCFSCVLAHCLWASFPAHPHPTH